MNTRAVKRIVKFSLATIIPLGLALVIHIYLVTGEQAIPEGAWRFSRIEISNAPIDSVKQKQATDALESIPDVLHYHINPQNGYLSYATLLSSEKDEFVFTQFMSKVDFEASLYSPSKEDLKKACPIPKDSFWYRTVSFFQ